MKKILLLITLLSFWIVASASEFVETYDVSAKGFSSVADKVVVYHQLNSAFDLDYQQLQLDEISTQLSQLENMHKNDPLFIFVQALHARNLASLTEQQGNISATQSWLNKKDQLLIKAMQLDAPEYLHLSAAIYATIKKSLPDTYKQQAIAAELKLGGNGENEAYYWYLHWSNINQLQKQAIQTMNDELAAKESDVAAYYQISNRARLELENLKKPAQDEKITVATELKEKNVVTERPIEEAADDNFYLYLIFIIIMIVVLLVFAAAVYIFEKRKHR